MLKVNLRAKSAVFWLFCFPIVLSTMFLGMFSNLGEAYRINTMRFVVVTDQAFCDATAARTLIGALQQDPVDTPNCKNAVEVETIPVEGVDLRNLLKLQPVDDVASATDLINDNPDIRGFLSVDDEGMLSATISRSAVSHASDATQATSLPVTLSILNETIGVFNRQQLEMANVAKRDPNALHDDTFLRQIAQDPQFSKEITLTHFKPDQNARYYYALLAMTALMATTFAVTTVCTTQANLSALGMRRSLAPLARSKQLLGGFLASWLCTIAALLVALLYIHFVCGVGLGGRWAAVILAIFIASLASNAIGTLLGALPRLSNGAKIGLSTAIACVCSLFSGLYGEPAMLLSDTIQRNTPVLSLINPTQQVTNLFYDILYYDSYAPFWRTVGILMAMTVICLAAATALLRRQRYAHL
nr:ABC transporter permease [Bifidobacterium gallicum]